MAWHKPKLQKMPRTEFLARTFSVDSQGDYEDTCLLRLVLEAFLAICEQKQSFIPLSWPKHSEKKSKQMVRHKSKLQKMPRTGCLARSSQQIARVSFIPLCWPIHSETNKWYSTNRNCRKCPGPNFWLRLSQQIDRVTTKIPVYSDLC